MNTLNPTASVQDQLETRPKERCTVLVVDDSSDIRSMIGGLLADWGFFSLTAPDGVTALEQLSQQRIRIMLTDYQMPRLNGLQLLKRVQAQYPGIQVIVISGESSNFLITKARDLGAFDWITKPFDVSHLKNTVEKAWQTFEGQHG
jgi:DNA-binding NtrC family response regulator